MCKFKKGDVVTVIYDTGDDGFITGELTDFNADYSAVSVQAEGCDAHIPRVKMIWKSTQPKEKT